MSLESNKTLVRDIVTMWHEKAWDKIDALFAPSFVNHDPDQPKATDRAGYRDWTAELYAAFPTIRISIQEPLIAEGDYVCKRWKAQCTDPHGKEVSFTGTTVYRMHAGRVAECWWNKDTAGLVRQLGEASLSVQ